MFHYAAIFWRVVSVHQTSESNRAALYLTAGEYYLHRLLSAAYYAILWIHDRWFHALLGFIMR